MAVAAAHRGHDVGDVFRLGEALERRALDEALDLLLGFAVGEQGRVDHPGRDGVHRDLFVAELLGEDARIHLVRGLCRRVGAVGFGFQQRDAR